MHAFFTTLTTATLLIHSVIGCCWGSVALATEKDTAVVECGASSCCAFGQVVMSHCDGDSDHDQSPCPPQPGRSPCHGVCTYVLPQKMPVDHAMPHSLYISPSPVCLSLCNHAILNRVEAFAVPNEPPLRLHLLNQILLI